jgi:adenylate cyclase
VSNDCIKVLLVEDNPTDVRLLQKLLAKAQRGQFELVHFELLGDAVTALSASYFDVILLDLSLPDSKGLDTVKRMYAAAPDVPILVLTGLDAEEIALAALREGAQDYLIKSEIQRSLLVRAIHYAIERKHILQRLRQSEARYRGVVEDQTELICRFFPDGTLTFVNQAFCRYFGKQSIELIGHTFMTLIPDEDWSLVAANWATIIQENPTATIEYRVMTPNGEVCWQQWSNRGIFDAKGCLIEYQSVGRDITKRKRTQQRLAAQYATTRILSESTPLEQVPLKILQAICENLGWDVGEFWIPGQHLGVSGQEGHPIPTKLQCVESWVRPSIVIPEFTNVTGQATFASGEGLPGRIWETLSPQWIQDVVDDASFVRSQAASKGGLHGAFGFPIDADSELLGVMTFFSRNVQPPDEYLLQAMATIGNQLGQFIRRKQAQEKLRESEERYRDLFENASDLIQFVAPDGRFIYVNRSWRETLGYNEAEIANLTYFDIIHPSYKAHYLRVLQRVVAGERVDQVQATLISKDGRKILVEGSVNCKFVDGKPVATRGMFRDITQRVQAEAALLIEQDRAERLLLNILPAAIAERLKQDERTIAEDFAEVTVLFADIVGFTELSTQTAPTELVELLNMIFSEFDRLAEQHGVEKIKTIGDAYMVAGGLPVPKENHAEAIAQMALDMQAAIAQFSTQTGKPLSIRIGINTGPVVAGVIGKKKFSYDLWGDTVNIASRMESQSWPGYIQVSESTYKRLRKQYLFKERGRIYIKGKGEMTTYFLLNTKVQGTAPS